MANKLKQAIDTIKNNPTLTVKEQLGYCGGIFGNCMGQDSIGTYDDVFCRDFMGISAADQQKKGNINEIIGFLIPPIAGALYDTNRKPGKMTYVRAAIGLMPIPFAIASMLLFIVPFADSTKNYIWTLILGLIFSISDTFFDTAMSTLGLRMVPNPKDRKNFYTLTSLASTLGSMLPGWIIPIIIERIEGYQAQKWGYFYIALVFCILGLATMYSCFICVKDKPVLSVGNHDEEKVQWSKEKVIAILRNRPFIITQISLICDALRQVTYKSLPYLYKDVFNDYGMKAIIDAVSGALSYVGLFAVPIVGSKVSARNMMFGGYAYTGFFYALMSAFNFMLGFGKEAKLENISKLRKYRYAVGIMIGLAGMPNSAQGAARKIIVADATDYMEWYSAKRFGTPIRSDGILSAAQSLFGKVIALTKTNAYNFLIRKVNYISYNAETDNPVKLENGTYQTNETLRGLYRVVTLCGLAGNVLSAICFLFDNYTGKKKEEINRELEEIRSKRITENISESI